jgi:hypothetical protein
MVGSRSTTLEPLTNIAHALERLILLGGLHLALDGVVVHRGGWRLFSCNRDAPRCLLRAVHGGGGAPGHDQLLPLSFGTADAAGSRV